MELLKTQSQEEKQTNSELLEFEQVENTPFTIVKNEENYFGVIGKHRITENYENKEYLKEDLIEFSWDRLVQVVWAINEKYNTKLNENE